MEDALGICAQIGYTEGETIIEGILRMARGGTGSTDKDISQEN